MERVLEHARLRRLTFKADDPTVLSSESMDLYMSFWFFTETPLSGSSIPLMALIVVDSFTVNVYFSFLNATTICRKQNNCVQ